MICDKRGNPLFFVLTAGNVHDSKAFAHLLRCFLSYATTMGWSHRFSLLAGDKGYDSAKICEQCRENGITPVIPKRKAPNGKERSDPQFNKTAYRRRNVIERCFGWLKECRRIATRYEKLASTYAAMLYLACARRLLRSL